MMISDNTVKSGGSNTGNTKANNKVTGNLELGKMGDIIVELNGTEPTTRKLTPEETTEIVPVSTPFHTCFHRHDTDME